MRTYAQILHDLLDGIISVPSKFVISEATDGGADPAILVECAAEDALKLLGKEAKRVRGLQSILSEIATFRGEKVWLKVRPEPEPYPAHPSVPLDPLWKRDNEVAERLKRLMSDLGFNEVPPVRVISNEQWSDFIVQLPDRTLISTDTAYDIQGVFSTWGKLNGRNIRIRFA